MAFHDTLDFIFLAFTVFTKTMVTTDSGNGTTKDRMWRALIHSFLAAENGVGPTLDVGNKDYQGGLGEALRGKVLAGGYFLVPWMLKGDMEFMVNHYEMPGHWSSHHPMQLLPCEYCGGPNALVQFPNLRLEGYDLQD